MISFSEEVKLHQEFTRNADLMTHSFRMLRMEGSGAHMLDAIGHALLMLEQQPPGRRRIILLIAEKRDRGSEAQLTDIVERVQRLNATIYWLTYPPFLEPFTARPRTMEDLKPEAERIREPICAGCPAPDTRGAPFDPGPGGAALCLGGADSITPAGSLRIVHENYRWARFKLCEEGRPGAGDSDDQRRGASPIPAQL